MFDLAMVGIVVVGFILLLGYAKLCVRLMPIEKSNRDSKA